MAINGRVEKVMALFLENTSALTRKLQVLAKNIVRLEVYETSYQWLDKCARSIMPFARLPVELN